MNSTVRDWNVDAKYVERIQRLKKQDSRILFRHGEFEENIDKLESWLTAYKGAIEMETTLQEQLIQLTQELEQYKKNAVKLALNSLSYSETECVKLIVKEMDDCQQKLIVASQLADDNRVTRSVIVNALRKLEAAGVIETRSLGMKGTHIKVLNGELIAALDRLD